MLAIETYNLSKKFGDAVAVCDLRLRIPKGILFGFLGPNGSGKSTTLRLLTGLLWPTTGEVIINAAGRRRRGRSQKTDWRTAGKSGAV